jgi:hypothetical protein
MYKAADGSSFGTKNLLDHGILMKRVGSNFQTLNGSGRVAKNGPVDNSAVFTFTAYVYVIG